MHSTSTFRLLVSATVCIAATSLRAAEPPFRLGDHARVVLPFVTKYCVECHGPKKQEAGVRVDTLKAEFTPGSYDADTWIEVMNQISQNGMPPEKSARRPTADEIDAVRSWIIAAQEHAVAASQEGAGQVVLRRLNRTEYDHTIRSVFGVDMQLAQDFPDDETDRGFDNNGRALTVSSVLMGKYLRAAQAVVDRCFPSGPQPEPLRAHFDNTNHGNIWSPVYNQFWYLRRDVTFAVKLTKPGLYRVTLRAARIFAKDPAKPTRLDLFEDLVGARTIAGYEYVRSYEITADEYSGGETVTHEFVVTPQGLIDRPSRGFGVSGASGKKQQDSKNNGEILLASVDVEGPIYDVWPSPAFVRCFPDRRTDGDVKDMRRIVRNFGAKIYRRPITDDDLPPLEEVYAVQRDAGADHLAAMREVFKRMLISPSFIYLVEESLDDAKKAINDYELASRLSYFLWSSPPDDALYAAAAAGKLRDPRELDAQVVRMLADPQSQALVDNLSGQWLAQRKIDTFAVDKKQFPDWDESLRSAMLEETRAFFDEILRHNRSTLEFLDSDWTMLNERLARHYGIPGVEGSAFRRVTLPPGSRRGGLITQASMMKILSDGIDSKPITRATWILENLLGDPPPPPPPNIDATGIALKSGDKPTTLRERLENHRKIPACYSCHRKIDAIGFGLENYDAIGGWRDTDPNGLPIDAAGSLPGGGNFSGPQELKRSLLDRQDDFCRCLTEKFLTYALGRRLEYSDREAVAAIAHNMPQHGYTMSGLIQDIVRSPLFRQP